MLMVPFHELCPDVAQRETRCITVLDDDGPVPKGEYLLLESYCNKPGCDCRRVFINVVRADREGILATIGYGWEDVGFYRKWMGPSGFEDVADRMAGARLEPVQRQSDLAPALFDLMVETALSDRGYVERLKRHYAMFKQAVNARAGDDAEAPRRSTPRVVTVSGVSRNAPCPCGSGKKYKRCCGR